MIPPSGPRCITREIRPTHPLMILSHCRTIGSRTPTTTCTQQWTSAETQPTQAPTIESNSFHLAGAAPHYFHGVRVGHTTPEPRSNPNVLPLSESPCISPTASRTDLSDTNEVYPVGTNGFDIAPMHHRCILRWRVRLRPRTQTRMGMRRHFPHMQDCDIW